jgi:hypothetical protein
MRSVAISTMLLFAAIASGADAPPKASGTVAVDDLPKASGTLDGKKVQFPAKGVAEGVKATIGLLESCHAISDGTIAYTAADLKKAQQGDHVRLVFTKPITVTVLGNKIKVLELVFTQPLNTGVFWLRSGDKVVRCTKYEFEKQRRFEAWRNEAQPAD